MTVMFLVAIGNMFDGFRFVGGFRTYSEAEDWANGILGPEEWNIIPVESPESVEEEGD
jgi:hypothetical protein